MPQLAPEAAAKVYRNSIVIDATAPILVNDEDWPKWQQGGVTCAFATLTISRGGANMPGVITSTAAWFAKLRKHGDRLLHAGGPENPVQVMHAQVPLENLSVAQLDALEKAAASKAARRQP